MQEMDFSNKIDQEIAAQGAQPVTVAQINVVLNRVTQYMGKAAGVGAYARGPRYFVIASISGEYTVIDRLAGQIIATFYDMVTYHESGQSIPVLVGQANADRYARDRNLEAGCGK